MDRDGRVLESDRDCAPLRDAALRVLASIHSGAKASATDVDLIRGESLPHERDLDLNDHSNNILARTSYGR